ncbi:MAG: hypothetical protein GWN58_65230, partial [Anaerolineae bacterium]|nr:hypothetical protein [Anaerolineae bacterium]
PERAGELQLFDVGNNLLASLGKQGRDFHEQLQLISASFDTQEYDDGFIEPQES